MQALQQQILHALLAYLVQTQCLGSDFPQAYQQVEEKNRS